MEIDALAFNAQTIREEFVWFEEILKIRFEKYFQQSETPRSIDSLAPPELGANESVYAEIVNRYSFGPRERIILLLALAPHVYPSLLDIFFTQNPLYNRNYTDFGGTNGKTHSGFLPTGETAIFLLAGSDMQKRFEALELFKDTHPLIKQKIISLEKLQSNEPDLSGNLSISREYLTYFTSGEVYKPDFSMKFPAKLLTTKLDWEDLILEKQTRQEVEEIQIWLENRETIMSDWGLDRKIKPGYRALFYGPPGTGKTLTASLIGKSFGLDVYRIDLSQVVSKYIGETEKNMANIFDQAENKNWILFFDEADALFGKRTSTTDAKDRHANQEVAYLLQRVEDFSGVVILASNLKGNIDKAFYRRFQSSIYFPMPKPEQRLKLWENAFAGSLQLDHKVDLESIAYEYTIAGGGVINVLRYCAIAALRRGTNKVLTEDIVLGISREYSKEGKIP